MIHDLQSLARFGRRVRNSDTVVSDREENFVVTAAQIKRHATGHAMLDGIIDRLLSNSKQVGCFDLVLQEHWRDAPKGASDVEKLAYGVRKLRERILKIIGIRSHWVQSMREIARLVDRSVQELADFLRLLRLRVSPRQQSAVKQTAH